jgi:Family of unknown function (DUF6069)
MISRKSSQRTRPPMSATAVAPARTRRTSRAAAAGLAAVGALLVWLVADPLLGVDFEVTRSGTTTVVGPGMVITMALGAGAVLIPLYARTVSGRSKKDSSTTTV